MGCTPRNRVFVEGTQFVMAEVSNGTVLEVGIRVSLGKKEKCRRKN